MLIDFTLDLADKKIFKQLKLVDFILEFSKFLPFGIIPPYKILNLYLMHRSEGFAVISDITWEAFSIEESVYEKELKALCKSKVCDIPEDVVNTDDWYFWCCQFLHDLPFEEHKTLHEETLRLEKERDDAYKIGEEDKGYEIHKKYLLSSVELLKLKNKFINN